MSSIEQKQAAKAIRESRSGLSGIVESVMDAGITIDSKQRILLFNQASEKMFLCTAQEAAGQSLQRFIPDGFRSAHLSHIQSFGEIGISARAMTWTRRAGFDSGADRTEFPVMDSIFFGSNLRRDQALVGSE